MPSKYQDGIDFNELTGNGGSGENDMNVQAM